METEENYRYIRFYPSTKCTQQEETKRNGFRGKLKPRRVEFSKGKLVPNRRVILTMLR